MRLWLIGGGIVLEVTGLLLVAAAEVVPVMRRVGSSASRLGNVVVARARILLRRRRNVTVHAGIASSVALSGHASVLTGIGADRSDADKLDYLLRQDSRHQERLNSLEHTVADLPGAWRQDIGDARSALETLLNARIQASGEAYLGARRLVWSACS